MSHNAPSDWMIPAADSHTTRDLLSRYLRLQLRTLLQLPLQGPNAGIAGPFQAQMRALLRTKPGLVFSILRRPTVGGLLRFLASGEGDARERAAWSSALITQIAFELFVHEALESPITVHSPPSPLIAHTTGYVWPLAADTTQLHFAGPVLTQFAPSGSQRFERGNTPWEQRFHPIQGDLVLALVDNNPRADAESHPDKPGNRVDLGGQGIDQWTASLNDALDIIETVLPTLHGECHTLVQQFIPVGYDRERHLSASFQEVIGSIYLSLHPEPMTMAEAIVHELSHQKINLLDTLHPLLHNGHRAQFSSPLRPDLRPMHGILLAVHAFLPVERLYEQLAANAHPQSNHPRFAKRRQEIRALNQAAAETVLAHAETTPMGAEIVQEIEYWNRYFAGATRT